jgi:hypothetical protein
LNLEKLEEWVTPGGEAIASWFRSSGTFRALLTSPGLPSLAPTGLPIELFGMDRSEIRDGKLARHQIFWDMVELGRQIGAFSEEGDEDGQGLAPSAAANGAWDAAALAFSAGARSWSLHSRRSCSRRSTALALCLTEERFAER